MKITIKLAAIDLNSSDAMQRTFVVDTTLGLYGLALITEIEKWEDTIPYHKYELMLDPMTETLPEEIKAALRGFDITL